MGFQDCPKCGRKESAWEGRFCGSCEEAYQQEQERWYEHMKQEAQEKADKLNAEVRSRTSDWQDHFGDDFPGPYYVAYDELGQPYCEVAEI